MSKRVAVGSAETREFASVPAGGAEILSLGDFRDRQAFGGNLVATTRLTLRHLETVKVESLDMAGRSSEIARRGEALSRRVAGLIDEMAKFSALIETLSAELRSSA
jgi:hypothetical protein